MNPTAAPSPEAQIIPVPVKEAIRAWKAFRPIARAFTENAMAVHRRFMRETGGEFESPVHDASCADDKLSTVEHHIRRLFTQNLVRAASENGLSLKIPDQDRDYRASDDSGDFDPARFWEYLYGKYGAERGVAVAMKDAATPFRACIELKPGESPEVVKGAVVLPVSVRGDYISDYSLGYQDIDKIVLMLDGLHSAAIGAGLFTQEDYDELRKAREFFSSRSLIKSRYVMPRKQVGTHILIVPGRSECQFRLTPAFAEQVQIYLAAHGVL